MKPLADPDYHACASRRGAFTLVELLTVIAIIAILAAIIFPAFAGVQENVRRANTMDNLRKLYVATRQYELDNRRYPEYLFGPALNKDGTIATSGINAEMTPQQVASDLRATITAGMPKEQRTRIGNVQAAYAESLFPNYINDLAVYTCRNNTINATSHAMYVAERPEQDPANPNNVNYVAKGYYRFDAYDVSPLIVSNNDINLSVGVARYSRVWYSPLLDRSTLENQPQDFQELYKNQLIFRNPSSDTYLTMTTYHVPKGKVVVIWMNGTAKVIDTAKLSKTTFASTDQDSREADFFKMTPSNY